MFLQNHLDTYEIPNLNFRFRKKFLPPTEEIVYRCEICPDAYQSEDEVIVHRRVAHKSEMLAIEKDPNSCKICVLKFMSREKLYKHFKTFHLLSSEDATQIEREIFVCEHCNAIFFKKTLLIFHIKFEHGGPIYKWKSYTCPVCGLRRKTKCLWVHFHNHDLKSLSCCPICFTKSRDCDDLVKEHCKSHQKHFVCSSCDHVSTKQCEHATHCAKHDKEDIRLESEKTNVVSGVNRFIYHNMIKNVKVQQLGCLNGVMLPLGMSVCVMCKYIATSCDDMERHASLDHGSLVKKKKQAYKCTECHEEFFNAVLLKQHRFKGCPLSYIEIRIDEESQEGIEVLNILEPITDETTNMLEDSSSGRELVSGVPDLIDDITE